MAGPNLDSQDQNEARKGPEFDWIMVAVVLLVLAFVVVTTFDLWFPHE